MVRNSQEQLMEIEGLEAFLKEEIWTGELEVFWTVLVNKMSCWKLQGRQVARGQVQGEN